MTKAEIINLVTARTGMSRKDAIEALEIFLAAIKDGTVQGGMIPKLEEAMAVVDQGVGAIHILGKLGPGDLVRAAMTALGGKGGGRPEMAQGKGSRRDGLPDALAAMRTMLAVAAPSG
jgi:alanyl-tRNA synthetase